MASSPSRAVATTRNSPSPASPPPSTSTRTRRMSALSAATTTVGRDSDDLGIASHRADFHAAVFDVKAYAAATLAADRFPKDGNVGGAQRAARREHVALPHLNRSRRHQLAEHARPPGKLGDEAPGIGPKHFEPLDQQRDGGIGKL